MHHCTVYGSSTAPFFGWRAVRTSTVAEGAILPGDDRGVHLEVDIDIEDRPHPSPCSSSRTIWTPARWYSAGSSLHEP